MFGKKKPPKEPDYTKILVLPNKLAQFVQAKTGLTPEELHKLFASIGRVDDSITIARRQKVEGKEYSKVVSGRKPIPIVEAVKYERERIDNWLLKEQKVQELFDSEVNFDELMLRLEVNNSFYPKRLAPADIVNYVGSAGEKLDTIDLLRKVPKRTYSPREETVLDVITLIKKQEPLRVAKHIADRQRAYIFSHSLAELEAEYKEWLRILKGEPTEEEQLAMEEAKRAEAERIAVEEARVAAEEAARNFADLPDVRTLLDDAAALIRENPEAAAAIIRQWIGNAVLVEKGTGAT
jgi:hypothetical protein